MYTVQDAFHITGKGYVLAVLLPDLPKNISIQDVKEDKSVLEAGDKIAFDDGEEYHVVAIERFRNALGPSRNVGVLILGDLRNDKNTYHGRTFQKVEVSDAEHNAKQRARLDRHIEKLTKQIAELDKDLERVQSVIAKEVIIDATIDAKNERISYIRSYPKYNDGKPYEPQN